MLDCALRYATRWAVFPCKPGEKRPACEHGCKDATTDETQIREWWTRWPSANIGVATGAPSGLFVLDVDGEAGFDALAELAGEIPATLTQVTPSGGAHFLFTRPTELGNSARKLGANLDTRGDGGYIVVAPSVHPNGGKYRWANRNPVEPPPPWLLMAVRPLPERTEPRGGSRYPQEGDVLAPLVKVAAEAQPGNRNEPLYWAAKRAAEHVAKGEASEREAFDRLFEAAEASGHVAKDGAHQAKNTLRSAGLGSGVRA